MQIRHMPKVNARYWAAISLASLFGTNLGDLYAHDSGFGLIGGVPILAALAVFFFLANWNSFLWPLTVTNSKDLWVVQVGIASFRSQYASSWQYIMAASTIVAAPMLVIFVIFQKQIMESIKTSGLK